MLILWYIVDSTPAAVVGTVRNSKIFPVSLNIFYCKFCGLILCICILLRDSSLLYFVLWKNTGVDFSHR